MVAPRYAAALTLIGAALLLPSPACAEPLSLEPSGHWNVHYGEDVCLLYREFGEGKNKHLLTVRQYWPAPQVGMTVAGPKFGKFRSRERTAVRFLPDKPAFDTRPFAGTAEGYGPAVIFSSIDIASGEPIPDNSDEPDGPDAIGQLDLSGADEVRFVELRQGARIVRLETGPLTAAFKVMNDCTFSLIKDWGLDAERLRTAQSGPRWINQASLTRKIAARYPGSALLAGEQGIMRMRVIVDSQGNVEECVMQKATNTKTLESPACDIMRNAKFDPARDASGQPLRSFYATSITYQIGS